MRVPTFRYFGAKASLMPKLLPMFPDHRTYVSVFGGSAADIAGKPKSTNEVYNDLNTSLATFFRVLHCPGDLARLLEICETLPMSRELFPEYERYAAGEHEDPVYVAAGVYYTSCLSFAGRIAGVKYSVGFGIRTTEPVRAEWRNARTRIMRIAQRFREVWVENSPWQSVVRKFDRPGTFFYLDPPYVNRTRRKLDTYAHEMTDGQHIELLERLNSLEGFAMLSGYGSELYEDYLAYWRRVEIPVRCRVSQKKDMRTEVVWMNYDTAGRHLFFR